MSLQFMANFTSLALSICGFDSTQVILPNLLNKYFDFSAVESVPKIYGQLSLFVVSIRAKMSLAAISG